MSLCKENDTCRCRGCCHSHFNRVTLGAFYVGLSYGLSNSVGYVFNNIAFLQDLFKTIQVTEDPRIEYPSYGIFIFKATALLIANYVNYYTRTRHFIKKKWPQDEKQEFLVNNANSEKDIPPSQDACTQSLNKSHEIAGEIGAFYKALSMALSTYLLIKKLSGCTYLPIIPAALLSIGNWLSQKMFFRDQKDSAKKPMCCACCVRANRFWYNYISLAYSINTSASYFLNLMLFVESLTDNKSIQYSFFAIFAALGLLLGWENYRTYYNLTRKHFNQPPDDFRKNSCVTYLGALFKAGAMACAGGSLLQGKFHNLACSIIFPGFFLPGNFASQVGLFSNVDFEEPQNVFQIVAMSPRV